MIELDKEYQDELQIIEKNIQASEHLKLYLDEEADEHFNALKDEFEPQIEELYNKVAEKDPLQLIQFEEKLLDTGFEGLFLPRILGYSVLRGAVNDNYKYIRPQEHFKKVLITICESFNFDQLKNRVGQTIEVGFALSSDIWITNLINELDNKVVKNYLRELKLTKYADRRSRHTSYVKYAKQFVNFNYLTADLPKTAPELKIEYKSIKNFLEYRASRGSEISDSLRQYIDGFIENENLGTSREYLQILELIGLKFDLTEKEQITIAKRLNAYKGYEEEAIFFEVLVDIQERISLAADDYVRMFVISKQTELELFPKLMTTINEINEIGYLNADAADIARSYHNSNEGLSPQNECLRNFIFDKFRSFMQALAEDDFNEYFELNKVFTTYMNAFDNEQFNQNIKGISLSYVKKLLRHFTEKRSKDYQDIKKFVSSVFFDLNFLKEKEIKELFKTKRKKKVAS